MPAKPLLLVIGFVNLLVLGFLLPFMPGELLAAQDPLFFSGAGVLMIGLWGAAYLATINYWQLLPGLMWVFALEKTVFALRWGWWFTEHHNQIPAIAEQSIIVALFYGGYGLWDAACAMAFAVLAWQGKQMRTARQ